MVEELAEVPMPEGTLLNVNCPAGEAQGATAPAGSASAIYRDRMKLDRGGGRAPPLLDLRRAARATTRRTAPTSPRSPTARIAVTPLHFDLTDQAGIESLEGFDLDRLMRPAAREV